MKDYSTSPVSNKFVDEGILITNTSSKDTNLDIFDFDEIIKFMVPLIYDTPNKLFVDRIFRQSPHALHRAATG